MAGVLFAGTRGCGRRDIQFLSRQDGEPVPIARKVPRNEQLKKNWPRSGPSRRTGKDWVLPLPRNASRPLGVIYTRSGEMPTYIPPENARRMNYLIYLAEAAMEARRSKCLTRRVGAVVVDLAGRFVGRGAHIPPDFHHA